MTNTHDNSNAWRWLVTVRVGEEWDDYRTEAKHRAGAKKRALSELDDLGFEVEKFGPVFADTRMPSQWRVDAHLGKHERPRSAWPLLKKVGEFVKGALNA